MKNHRSYDRHLWYLSVKSWYLQAFFSHFFKILICWIVRRVKGQKMAQNGKKFCSSHLISQEPNVIWFSFIVHTCKKMISPVVVVFLPILIFGVNSEVKGQKMAQNNKIFCLSHSISQDLCLVWLWFLVHMCKMRSPASFLSFSKFWFFRGGFCGGWQKIIHNYQFQSFTLNISRTVDHIIKVFGTQV